MIDTAIQSCNKAEVSECLTAIAGLTAAAREELLAEYHRRPDIRFGDSLLVALSIVDR